MNVYRPLEPMIYRSQAWCLPGPVSVASQVFPATWQLVAACLDSGKAVRMEGEPPV